MLGRHSVKHKFNGNLMVAVCIALVATFVEWLFILLFSLNWALVYIALFAINIPIVYWLMGIYHRTHCYTIDEFFYELVAYDDNDEEVLEDEDETLLESLD